MTFHQLIYFLFIRNFAEFRFQYFLEIFMSHFVLEGIFVINMCEIILHQIFFCYLPAGSQLIFMILFLTSNRILFNLWMKSTKCCKINIFKTVVQSCSKNKLFICALKNKIKGIKQKVSFLFLEINTFIVMSDTSL